MPANVDVPVVERVLVKNLAESFELPEPLVGEAVKKGTLLDLSTFLTEAEKKQAEAVTAAQAAANQLQDEAEKTAALEKSKALAESKQAKALRERLSELIKHKGKLGLHIWQSILTPYFPKFLYFDEYYKMRGHDNIEALKKRKAENNLQPSDHPLLGLIELARLDLDKLLTATRTQELKNKLQERATISAHKF